MTPILLAFYWMTCYIKNNFKFMIDNFSIYLQTWFFIPKKSLKTLGSVVRIRSAGIAETNNFLFGLRVIKFKQITDKRSRKSICIRDVTIRFLHDTICSLRCNCWYMILIPFLIFSKYEKKIHKLSCLNLLLFSYKS
jgi:hypothetical protein